MTLDPLEFRRVVGQFATGVAVVTTSLHGELHAMTCSSFTSVSLEPLLVLFCAEKVARFHDAVRDAGTWAVSVLSRDQEPLSRRFAVRGRELGGQFDGVPYRPGPVTGAPQLVGALSVLECRTAGTADGGDHTVVVGEVLSGELGSGRDAGPLLYFGGRYQGLDA